MSLRRSHLGWLAGMVLVILASFVAGVYLGFRNQPTLNQILGLKHKEVPTVVTAEVDFAPFWEAWQIIDDKFVNGHATTTGEMVDTTQNRVWGAIGGLVASLDDPYSVFLPPVENENFAEEIQGNFGGIGIEIGVRQGLVTVIAALPETPAKRAGLRSGDIIVAIDGQPTTELNVDQMINLIRGEIGTAVKLSLSRPERSGLIEVSLTRALINIPTLETTVLPSGVFLIRLFNFSASAPELFRQALRQFAESGQKKMILDLRGNPGGYLEAAVDMASWFLPAEATVAIESRGEKLAPKTYRSRGYDVFDEQLKLVILIDRGSASAAEILAGALAEHGVATLVGEQTFGKGSVQELIPLTQETALKLTVARWLTPKGVSLSQNGLHPDVEVKSTVEDGELVGTVNDPFVKAALEVLAK